MCRQRLFHVLEVQGTTTVLEGEGQHSHSIFLMQVVLGSNMISKIGSFENLQGRAEALQQRLYFCCGLWMCQKQSKKQLPESTTEQLPRFLYRRHWNSTRCLPADINVSAERLWGDMCSLQMKQRKHLWAWIYWRFILTDWVFIPVTHLSWGFPCPQVIVNQNSVQTKYLSCYSELHTKKSRYSENHCHWSYI